MIQLLQAFINLFHTPKYDEYKLKGIKSNSTENDDEHDLGHASKCVWELDKEA